MIDSNALAIIHKNSVLDAFATGDVKVSPNASQPLMHSLKNPSPKPLQNDNEAFVDIVKQIEAKPAEKTNQATAGTSQEPSSSVSDKSFYLDQQSLTSLKYDNSQLGLMAAAQQFEALFIQSMLKRMRAASEALSNEDNPLSTKSSNLFQGMLDAQLAQTISRQSQFGLAEMIYQQLASRVPTDGANQARSLLNTSNEQARADAHHSAALNTVTNLGGSR